MKNNDYPQNLLDEIIPDGEWNFLLPQDFFQTLAYIIADLTEREAHCVLGYYRDGRTYAEIGSELGVTRERVRQLTERGVKRLSHPSRRKFLKLGLQGMINKKVIEARELAINDKLNSTTMQIAEIARKLSNATAWSGIYEIPELNIDEKSAVPIEELNLSVRSYNRLKGSGISKLGELADKGIHELERIPCLGRRSIDEITEKVHEMGLLFKDERDGNKCLYCGRLWGYTSPTSDVYTPIRIRYCPMCGKESK